MKNEKGQSLLELAICLPMLAILLLGTLDLGRAFLTAIAMEDGVGEAALFASIYPDCPTSNECAYPNNALDRAKESLTIPFVTLDDANLTVECFTYETNEPVLCEDAEEGDTIEVTMKYDYELLTPVVRKINGLPSLTLTSKATSQVLVP